MADSTTRNRILRHLPESELGTMRPHLQRVHLVQAHELFDDDGAGRIAYFPETALISLIAVMRDGAAVEYRTVGAEGMAPLQLALGTLRSRGRAICQLSGETWCIEGTALRELLGSAPMLRRLLLRYAQATINVLAQSAACNALHDILQRCARWLLTTHDRTGTDRFPMTQEFLAMMLGVRRAGVSEAAAALQRLGAIRYRRGEITVVERALLEQISCECYAVMRREYELVFADREAA
jgi:CRP-like cAMP-binding protein